MTCWCAAAAPLAAWCCQPVLCEVGGLQLRLQGKMTGWHILETTPLFLLARPSEAEYVEAAELCRQASLTSPVSTASDKADAEVQSMHCC